MKNILKIVCVVLLLTSCKDAPKSDAILDTNISGGILDEITGKNEDIDEKYALILKELGKKTLLTDDQLIRAYPKRIGNLKLDAAEPRITSSETVIGDFNDHSVRMEVLDAAGAHAYTAVIPLKMLQINKVTSENNNTIRYSKKMRDGLLTFCTDRDADTKADYQSELRFLYDNRFYVVLEGKDMTVEELWNSINTDDLKAFKAENH